jgi:hypothetical protein
MLGSRWKDGFQVMIWNKPRKLWQWLLLLTPAVEMMLVGAIPLRRASYVLPHDNFPDLTLDVYNLPVALALSIALGLWLCWREPHWASRVLGAISLGILIAFGNFAIGFAGCTLGHVLLDK